MANFAIDVVESAPPDRLAIVELARGGERREWSFGAIAQAARTLAAHLHDRGVRRGDTVLTLVGNQPDWVAAMVACFRQGYVVLPCNEQLRAKDLAQRLAACPPAAVVCDGRNEGVLRDAGWTGATIWVPGVAQWPVGGGAATGRADGARSLPDHVHERHRGRAEGRRPRPALPVRTGDPGRALARAAARRARLVHGCQRLEQVRAQRVHRALDPGRRGAAARRALRSGRAA